MADLDVDNCSFACLFISLAVNLIRFSALIYFI